MLVLRREHAPGLSKSCSSTSTDVRLDRGPAPDGRVNELCERHYPAEAEAAAATRSRSMSTRRRILPEGDFGISSTSSTARSFL
jgi:hypothetical protein